MRKTFLILFYYLLTTTFSIAQNCDCKATYEWVKETFEKNDAGFQYIINKKGKDSYNIHNQLYYKKVKGIKNSKDCESTIREWLSFFRKAHVEFHYIGKKEKKNNEPPKSDQNSSDIIIKKNDTI